MPRLLLGVSGGIAAYKALEFVRLATGAGHAVRVIQTPASLRVVGAASFAALTGAPVLSDEFERDPARGAFPGQEPPRHDPLSHLELVGNADLLLIAPATANTIAKLAHGQADNLLTSAALAATCPVIVAPAMNNHMWENAATRANVELLRSRGVTVLEPGVGRLGSAGEWGAGRLAEPDELLAAAEAALDADARPGGPWRGMHVLVTAGGTREPIDSVRFVGNRSSGRMGFALADAAAARGAKVTVVAANVALARNRAVSYIDVETAAELERACEAAFDSSDVLLMAAAVADFRPAAPLDRKIDKRANERLELELEPTTDVLAALGQRRRAGQTLIGFAAEHGANAEGRARSKLESKHLDAVVLNDISRADIGFDSGDNEIAIVTRVAVQRLGRAPKAAIAAAILDAVDALRAAASGVPEIAAS